MGEIKNSEEVAEFCGAMIGDGWIQANERSLFLAGDPTEDRDYYDLHISKFINEKITPMKTKEFPYWKVHGVSLHKKEIIRKIISDFNLPKGKKVKTAKIPEWINKSSNKVKLAFLRGLFDTDGCIFFQKDYTKYANEFNSKYHTKVRLRFGTVSPKLNKGIFELMDELGFRVVKRTIKRGFTNNRNNSDIHISEINEIKSIGKFFEEIKPANPKHTTKYLIWKKFGFCPPSTTIKQRKEILKSQLNPYLFYKQE